MAKFITQHRRGTTSEWQNSLVKPAVGELVIEECSDGQNKLKIGDGVSRFSELRYVDSELETKLNLANQQISQLISLPEGSTSGDAELQNIRIASDGTSYETAGDAVRAVEQDVKNLRVELQQFIGAEAVDGLQYEGNMLQLTSGGVPVGDPVEVIGGTGGTTTVDYVVRLKTTLTSTKFSTAIGSDTIIPVKFSETFGEDSTGVNGQLEVLYRYSNDDDWVNCESLSTSIKQNEETSIDVTDLIGNEYIYIRIQVTGGESAKTAYITFNIKPENISFKTDFKTTETYTGDVDIKCTFQGNNVTKILCVEIDDQLIESVSVGKIHNDSCNYKIDMASYAYGAHDLVMYFTTPEGATSNIERYTLLYNDGSSKAPLIGVIQPRKEITYGEPYELQLVVDTPDNESTSIDVEVYTGLWQEKTVYYKSSLDVSNNKLISWTCSSYPESGVANVKFTSGTTVKTIAFTVKPYVNEHGYVTVPVSSNLVYHYSATGKTNNDHERGTYSYLYTDCNKTTTHIKAENTGFNWVSNGYIETSDGTVLRFSGDARQIIYLPILSTSYVDDTEQTVKLDQSDNSTVTTRGRTIEFEYKVSNATNPNAQIIKCVSTTNNAGFVVTPQTCYLLSSGSNVVTDLSGFIKNENAVAAAYLNEDARLRVSFVIEARGTDNYEDSGNKISAQCVNIYVNGEYANSCPYDVNASFDQSAYIQLGDSSCILDLYDVRMYNVALDPSEILRNYNTSRTLLSDRLTQIINNNVLDKDGEVSYAAAKTKYACLLATGPLAPYKLEDSKYNCGWTLTLPADNEAGFVTEFELLDKDDSGIYVSQNNVQGTSSVKFPVKNYKVYLREIEKDSDGRNIYKTDDEGNSTLSIRKVEYSLKGKDSEGNDLSIGESTLCWKGDYMSSDHANTFNANLADRLFNRDTDAQKEDARVQNTVYGFRCLLFQRDTEDSPIKFAGDGALNNDKGNSKTFGLKCSGDKGNNTLRQKWEYKNSTDPLCLFQHDKLFEVIAGKPHVEGNVESTYPDEGDLRKEGLTPNYYPLQTLYTWVCQRANFLDVSPEDTLDPPEYYKYIEDGNEITKEFTNKRDLKKAIFKHEFEKHFNLHHALVYYLFTEFVALCDNRAKNMFLRSEDVRCERLLQAGTYNEVTKDGTIISIRDAINEEGEVDADKIDWENSSFSVWLTDLYDLDSCFGVENTGKLEIPYHAEWQYQLDNYYKFNGHESLLWSMFEEAFKTEIQKAARDLTNKPVGSGLNYASLYQHHIQNNALLMCPAIVNEDMKYKYHDPWIEGYDKYDEEDNTKHEFVHMKDYKYLQRGSRTYQKSAFIERRCNMLYSKYLCDKFIHTDNTINFRPKATVNDAFLRLKYNQTLYPAVRFGDGKNIYATCGKVDAGVEAELSCSDIGADSVGQNDTIYIGGGELVTDLGDISGFHPDELRLENGKSLKRIIVGSVENNYENHATLSINTSACKLLEEVNVANCKKLESLDLSLNGLIKKVTATGCNADVKLPNGGVLTELLLGHVLKIEVLNHPNFTTFNCDGYDKLKTLRVENTPNIPVKYILENYYEQLEGIRLVGINLEIDNDEFLNLLLDEALLDKYVDADGNRIPNKGYPYISGTITVNELSADLLKRLNTTYKDLKIVYNTLYCTVKFMGVSDEPIVQEINYVTDSTLEGYGENNAECPILSEDEKYADIVAPTMEPTAQYTFTWGGWATTENSLPEENILLNIQSNLVLYPAFNKTVNKYTVTFWNPTPEMNVKVHEVTVDYGSKVEYLGSHLSKLGTDAPSIYEWTGWNPAPNNVVEDMDCYAVFNLIDSKWYTLNPFDITHTLDGDRIDVTTCENKSNLMLRIPSTFELSGKTYKTRSLAGFGSANFKFVDVQENAETLEPYCFSNNSKLAEVYLPDSLREIKADAFNMCHQLEKVTIPKNVNSIAQGAFSQSTNIKELHVAPENITYTVTDNCLIDKINKVLIVGLNDSTIPVDGSVTTIGEEAFRGTAKEEIILPPVVNGEHVLLGSMCFADCQNLTEIVIPEGYTELVATVFAWSLKLRKVTLPNSLTRIGTYVFAQCPIEEITFPAGLKKIGDHSFANNHSLKKVVFKGTVDELHSGVFEDSGVRKTAENPDVAPWEMHVPWSEGAVDGAPWGAVNCKIVYNSIS